MHYKKQLTKPPTKNSTHIHTEKLDPKRKPQPQKSTAAAPRQTETQ